MPLLDHFRPPLYPSRSWESMHSTWANAIMTQLNEEVLPSTYFAESQVHIGSRVEVDVAAFERSEGESVAANSGNGSVATIPAKTWAPPKPSLVMPALFPDDIEVQILGGPTGGHLVAAIELISPGNKDRAEARQAFASKCASYLHQGVGLVLLDIVTERRANLHDELMKLLKQPESFHFPAETFLYGVSYRPVRRDPQGDQIDIWTATLAVGQSLPTLPLPLRGGPTLPLDLEKTYMEARRRSRLLPE